MNNNRAGKASPVGLPAPPAPVDALIRGRGGQPRRTGRGTPAGKRASGGSAGGGGAVGGDAAAQYHHRHDKHDESAAAAAVASDGSPRNSGSLVDSSASREVSAETGTTTDPPCRGSRVESPGGETASRKVSRMVSADDHRALTAVSSSGTAVPSPRTRGSQSTPPSPKRRARDRTGTSEDRHHSHENLHIRNVPQSMDERTLRTVFSQFGNITSAVIMRNIHTGESQGKAFVRFDTEAEAARAMDALNGAASASSAAAGGGGGGGRGAGARRAGGGGGGSAAASAGSTAGMVFTDEKGRPMTAQWARKQHDSAPVGPERNKMRKLFVRNIPANVTPEMLEALFKQFGVVSSVSLHHDTRAAMDTAPRHHTSGTASPIGNGGQNRAGGARGGATPNVDDERRIAFITYAEEGVAADAAQQVHNTMPFATCFGVPLMVKLAEDTPMRHGTTTTATGAGASGNNNSNNKPLSQLPSDAGRGQGTGSGYNSLNVTLSHLPSTSSPVRSSPGAFPGMMSLAGLSMGVNGIGGGGGGGGGGAGPMFPGPSGQRSTTFGNSGSPVLAHTMNSSSSAGGGTGFMHGTFSSLNNTASSTQYGASLGGPLPGSMSVPHLYMSLDGSPRFGTPSAQGVGAGVMPTVVLPGPSSAAGSPRGAGSTWGSSGYDGPASNTQTMTASPVYGALGMGIMGAAPTPPGASERITPVVAGGYNANPNAMRNWSAAASGAGSPIGASLFSAVLSPPGAPPPPGSTGSSGLPYPLPTPASMAMAGGGGVAAAAGPPNVYMPAPMYPPQPPPLSGEARATMGGSAIPALGPPSQGHVPPMNVFVDPAGGGNNFFGGSLALGGGSGGGLPFSNQVTPRVGRRSDRSSANVSPRDGSSDAVAHLADSPFPGATRGSASYTQLPTALSSLYGPAHPPSAPLVATAGRSSASGSTSSDPRQHHRRAMPRKHSSATSETSSRSNSTGNGHGVGAGGASGGAHNSLQDESSGLTMTQHRNAQLDDALAGNSSTSAEISPPCKVFANDTTVASLDQPVVGAAGDDAWSAASGWRRSPDGFKRPTMSLDTVMQSNVTVFSSDFNVFTPVAAGRSRGGGGADGSHSGSGEGRTTGASAAADATTGTAGHTDEVRCGEDAEGGLAPTQYGPQLGYETSAFDEARRVDGRRAISDAESGENDGSLEHHPSSQSFMNEETLQQFMSQFAAPSEDNEFF